MSHDPSPRAGAPQEPSVFISHSKSPAGSEALAMSYELDRNHVKNFLDSNDLAHLADIAPKVEQATHFFLLMSKYDANDQMMRFGPFSRYFCLIEIITWFSCRDEVQAVVVEIEQDSFGTSTFPDSQQAVDGLLEEADWAKLCEEMQAPNVKELVLHASLALMELPRFKWSPTDLSRSPAQLAALLVEVGVDKPAEPQLPQSDAVRLSVLCSKDGAVEAALIARTAPFEFPQRVDARINSDWESDHSVVVLTPDVLNDLAVLTRITSAKSPVLVTVSRPGLDQFPFGQQPTVGDDDLKQRFAETVKFLAKELSPHSTTPIVQVQMRLIWEGVGLKDSVNLFPNVPYLGDPYSVAVSKARSFAPGTGKWLFAKLEQWNRDKNMAFVLSGTGGLGKSVLAAELCARYSLAVAARAGRSAVETELPFVVAALHFFKHDDTRLNNTLAAIGSIARQLAESIDGFRSLLEEAVKGLEKLDDPTTLFRVCVLEPAKKAARKLPSGRVLIVLDALDECADQQVLFPLLAELWPEMPSTFGLVATTRPGVEVPKLNKFKPYTFEPAENERSGDIQLFVKHMLGDKATPTVVDTVRKNAAGLFIYAMFACKQLLEHEGNLDEAVRSLPVSMDATYVEYFTRFRKGLANEDFYLVVLAPILASRVPLPEKVWRETCMPEIVPENSGTLLAKINADKKFDKLVIAPLANLLDFSGGTVKVLHKTMDDFLRSSGEAKSHSLVVDIPVGHELIAKRAEGFAFRNPTWEPLNSDEERFYGAHSLYHLIEAGMLGGASKQVLEMDKLLRLVWAAEQDSSFARLIRDVQALLQVAENPKIKFALSLLHLSEKAAMKDPREFAGQILGRVMIAPFSKVQLFWIKQAQEWIERASGEGKLKIMVPMCFGRSGLQPAGTALVKVLEGHTDRVSFVAISSDCRFIVTRFRDKTARVWNFATGEERWVLEGRIWGVTFVAISLDSRFIVTGSENKTARVWDAQTGEERRVLRGHTERVTFVAISPDSKFVVTGSKDNTARVWDAQTGEERMVLEGHTNKVTFVAISLDSRFIVTGSLDSTARVWDAQTGEERMVLKGHTNKVTFVAISPDCSFIATGSLDKTTRVWDAQTGKERGVLEGDTDQVHFVAISHDSSFIVTVLNDYMVQVCDAQTGNLKMLRSHTSRVTSVAISPDSKFIVIGSNDNTARVCDAQTGEEMRVLEGHTEEVNSVAFSPDSRFIVTGSWDNTAQVWDFTTGEERRVLREHTNLVTSMVISSDSRFIVTGSEDKTAQVWDAQTGEEKKVLKGHTARVTSVAISPDSRFIVTGSWDKTARVWDAQTGEERMVLERHSDRVTSVAISPNSKYIVTGSEDKTARVWDAQTGEEKKVLKGHTARVTFVAISPDSGFIVTGSEDNTARVWDAQTGEEKKVLEGHTYSVSSVAISHDSGFVVTGSEDNTARVWDAQTGEERSVLKGHRWFVTFVAFSPDSRFIVTGSLDKTTRVWDLANDVQRPLDPRGCGFVWQTTDGSVVMGNLNTVGYTQDSHEHVELVGSAVVGKRKNDYECWALSTQSQCLWPVAESELPPSKRLKQSD